MRPGPVLQYLINNAGVAKWADLGSLEEADMLHLFRTNALGPLMVTQEVLREGLLKSGSVVANMTSKVHLLSNMESALPLVAHKLTSGRGDLRLGKELCE